MKQLRDEQQAESNVSINGDSGNIVHPTLANLYGVTARLDPSSSRLPLPLPEPSGLDHKTREESNDSPGDRAGSCSESAVDWLKDSKGKGKAKADDGCLTGVSGTIGTGGIGSSSPGFPFEGDNVSDGLGGANGGSRLSLASALSDMTRALGEPLYASRGDGVTTFEAEESGLLRALLRALLNGSITATPPSLFSGTPRAALEAAAASNSSSSGEACVTGLSLGSSPGMVGNSPSGWSSTNPNGVGAGMQDFEAASTLKGSEVFVEVR